MDDNINSIVYAVLYGRTIFRSIRKFIIFQSTINVASTLIVFLGPFLGFDFPLTLIQLLWVNLVMDTLAALAFGGEPALFRYMHVPPIRRDEAIVDPYMWSSIMLGGLFVAALSVTVLVRDEVAALFVRGDPAKPDSAVFLTAFFSFFIFICVVNAFNVRTKRVNIFDSITENRGFIAVLVLIFAVQIVFTYIGGKVLRTVPLRFEEWTWIIGAAFIIWPWDMLRKLLVAPWLPKSIKDVSGSETGTDPGEDSDDADNDTIEEKRNEKSQDKTGQPPRRSQRLSAAHKDADSATSTPSKKGKKKDD